MRHVVVLPRRQIPGNHLIVMLCEGKPKEKKCLRIGILAEIAVAVCRVVDFNPEFSEHIPHPAFIQESITG